MRFCKPVVGICRYYMDFWWRYAVRLIVSPFPLLEHIYRGYKAPACLTGKGPTRSNSNFSGIFFELNYQQKKYGGKNRSS